MSDPSEPSLASDISTTDDDCGQCYDLFHALESLQNESKNGDDELRYDINTAFSIILSI